MKIAINKERFRLYLWIGLVYLSIWLLVDVVNYPGQFWLRLLNNVWRAVYILIVNFIFLEYTLPFVRRSKYVLVRILTFLFALWIQLMLYSFGLYGWRALGIQLHLYVSLRTFETTMEGVNYGFPYGFASMFFFAGLVHLYDYNKLKAAAQQLRIEKQEAELNYLKSQTNPHFLFNTLNNIYSLARDKSDLAPESILRLSKILRFMLYETGGEYISIEQELKIISDYIELEKLRYDQSLRINFNYDVEEMRQAIPPLLLMPLVENAFKHGVSETRNGIPYVDIHLSISKRQLVFEINNSAGSLEGEGNIKENIGLSNLRRQLELLYTDYNLSIHQGDYVFTAILKINLASHVQNQVHNHRR